MIDVSKEAGSGATLHGPNGQYFYKVNLSEVETTIKSMASAWRAGKIVEEARGMKSNVERLGDDGAGRFQEA